MNKRLRELSGKVKLFFDRYWITLTCGMLMFALILQFFTIQKSVMAYASVVNDWGLGFGDSGTQPRGNVSSEKLAEYNAYYVGSPQEKTIYLTFDAGYENGYTEKILDVLKKHNVPAAFFLVSHYLKSNPEIVKRMADEGHIVANHTNSHPDMSKVCDVEGLKKELLPVEELYRTLTGQEMLKYYRPPQGKFNEKNLAAAKELGYTTVFWSLAYVDWDVKNQPDYNYAMEKLTSRIHNGAIILLHSTSETNAMILDELLDTWLAEGYVFKSLTELK